DFFKTSILGGILFLIGYMLSMECKILRLQEDSLYIMVSFSVLAILTLCVIVLTCFFPIYVRFLLEITTYLKWPLIVGIVHPILTLFLIVGTLLLTYVTFMTIPALLFFFGGSAIAFFIMWAVSKTFPKYVMGGA